MRRRIEIELMERETFYRYRWRRSRGTPVPGTETNAFRISVLIEGPGEQTWIHVRRDTCALAGAAAKELLGLSNERWAKMKARYRAKQARIKESVRRARRVKARRIAKRARRLSKSLRPS